MNIKDIAKERINILFREAELNYPKRKDRSDRYVEIARKISMRAKIPIPTHLKKKFCQHCHSYLKIGDNCTIRLKPKERVVSYMCRECKKEKRYQYS